MPVDGVCWLTVKLAGGVGGTVQTSRGTCRRLRADEQRNASVWFISSSASQLPLQQGKDGWRPASRGEMQHASAGGVAAVRVGMDGGGRVGGRGGSGVAAA